MRWSLALVRRHPLLVPMVVLLLALGAGSALAAGSGPGPRPAAGVETKALGGAPGRAQARPPTARAVLAAWDRHRSTAWSAGEPDRLRALYTAGSVAGRRDAGRLVRWQSRGLRVVGLRQEVLAFRVVSRTTTRLVVRVTDRVVGATAVGPGTRLPLPRDHPDTRLITLVHEEVWKVASVRRVR